MARGPPPSLQVLQQRLARERLAAGLVIVVLAVSLAAVALSRSGEAEVVGLLARSDTSEGRGAALPLASRLPPGNSGGEGAEGPQAAAAADKPRQIANLSAKFVEEHPKFILKHLSKAGGTFSNWLLRSVISKGEFMRTSYDDAHLLRNAVNHGFVAITLRNPCDWYVSWGHGAPAKVWGYHNPTFGPNPFLPKGYKVGPLTPQELHDFVVNARSPDGKGFLSWYMWQLVVAPRCNHFVIRRMRNENFQADQTPAICENTTRMWEDWRRLDPREIAHCYIFQETAMDDWRACLRAFQQVAPWARDAVNWTLFEALAANSTYLEEQFRKSKGEGEYWGKARSKAWKRRKSCTELMSHGELGRDIRSSDPWLFEKFGYSDCCKPSRHVFW